MRPRVVVCLALVLGLWLPWTALAQSEKRTVLKSTMHVDPQEMVDILSLLGVDFKVVSEHRTIVLRSADQGALDTALKVIEHLDTPTVDLQISVFILGASKGKSQASDVPEDLQPVVARLRDLFGYDQFKVQDTILVRAKNGSEAWVTGSLGGEAQAGLSRYQLSFRSARLIPQSESGDPEEAAQGDRFRFDNFTFRLGSDHEKSAAGLDRAGLSTDVEIREGQKAVVGKATPDGSDEALILVVEAQVLD